MLGLNRRWVRLAAVGLVAGAVLASLAAAPSPKVSVLGRARLGGYGEELTYVASGPLAKHVAWVDGYEIWGFPSQASGKPTPRKLFDLYALSRVPRPTGLAYVEGRQLFVVNDSGPSNFYFVDHQGRPNGGASMVFPLPDGYSPSYIEGLAYIPPTAGQFPDHLAMAAQNADGTADLLVADLAGQVKKHVAPQCQDASGNPVQGFGSLEYLPGDRFVLVDWNTNSLCVVDFDGVPFGPVVPVAGAEVGEGVARLGDGRIVVLDHPENLIYFDANLNRLPAADRTIVVGLGLNQAIGLAWNSRTSRHLVSYVEATAPASQPTAIAAVPANLATASNVVDLTAWPGYSPSNPLFTRGMTFLGPESVTVATTLGRAQVAPPATWTGSHLPWFRGLLLYDAAGTLAEQVDLCVPSAPHLPSTCTLNYGSLQPPAQWGRALQVAYIPGAAPGSARFAVRFRVGVTSPHPGVADSHTVYLFTRAGVPAGSLDFEATAGLATVTSLEYFDPGDGTGGQLAVIGTMATSTEPQLVTTDLAGNKLRGFYVRAELGLPAPSEISYIATGPHAGAFAVWDGMAQELVVFRMK